MKDQGIDPIHSRIISVLLLVAVAVLAYVLMDQS
jgi:hypothetical protein